MTEYYVCWVDDKPKFPASLAGHFEILKEKHAVVFEIDEHNNTDNFDTIARNITDNLICAVDYNLKNNKGEGIDGHEVIAMIRKYNQKCKIIFYSSKATQSELRALVGNDPNIICTLREDGLKNVFTDIANGSIEI